jgi:hypothetical protein
MTTPTDSTVPLPTATGKDDKDKKDDDDDDDVSSTAPAPTPTPPAPNRPAKPSPQASQTTVLSPTSTEASTSSTPIQESGNGGISVGVSAGIGAAVAIAIILLLLGGWFCVRRRRVGKRRKRTLSESSHDLENATKEGVHGAQGPAEMDAESRSEKGAFELASPIIPVEAAGDPNLAAELPGSEVPPNGVGKESGERLFPDSPIDDEDDRRDVDSKTIDGKKPPY